MKIIAELQVKNLGESSAAPLKNMRITWIEDTDNGDKIIIEFLRPEIGRYEVSASQLKKALDACTQK